MSRLAPQPAHLAHIMRALADMLDQHGDKALEMAPLLSARGWPRSTLGSGSAGNSELTTVEAAVEHPDPIWDHIDDELRDKMTETWTDLLALRTLITKVVAHAAPDQKRMPRPGSGDCFACGRYVSGSANDRLRAGYCDSCRMAWERAGRPDRVQFQRSRRRQPFGGAA